MASMFYVEYYSLQTASCSPPPPAAPRTLPNPAESKFKVPMKLCILEFTHLFWINYGSVKSFPHYTTVPPPSPDLPLPKK